MKIGREHASVAVYAKEIYLKMLHFKTNAERFPLHRILKKEVFRLPLWVPYGILRLWLSGFADNEPYGFSPP